MSSKNDLYNKVQEAKDYIAGKISKSPELGLVLGSGLGAFADSLERSIRIPFKDIPHFPSSNVEGHKGALVFGWHKDSFVGVLQGRVHYYEGHDIDVVTFPIRVLLALGIKNFVITNAAGGISSELTPGDLVLLEDHINFHGVNPLRGPNDDRFGPRFPDMSYAYDSEWGERVKKIADKLSISLKKGVYAYSLGPSYETPAEVRMFGKLGADVVGMSTVPEVIVVNHEGGKVVGISCVTNLAAGISENPLSHSEVTETGQKVKKAFCSLVEGIIEDFK